MSVQSLKKLIDLNLFTKIDTIEQKQIGSNGEDRGRRCRFIGKLKTKDIVDVQGSSWDDVYSKLPKNVLVKGVDNSVKSS